MESRPQRLNRAPHRRRAAFGACLRDLRGGGPRCRHRCRCTSPLPKQARRRAGVAVTEGRQPAHGPRSRCTCVCGRAPMLADARLDDCQHNEPAHEGRCACPSRQAAGSRNRFFFLLKGVMGILLRGQHTCGRHSVTARPRPAMTIGTWPMQCSHPLQCQSRQAAGQPNVSTGRGPTRPGPRATHQPTHNPTHPATPRGSSGPTSAWRRAGQPRGYGATARRPGSRPGAADSAACRRRGGSTSHDV